MPQTALGERLERKVRERAGRIAQTAATKMEVELKRNFQPHRKSGDTQRSISVRLETVTATSLTFVARATTPQARYVNDGTRPHPIAARGNVAGGSKWPSYRRGESLLVFNWPKAGMFPARFRWVQHPGYRGSGWWDYTIAQWHDRLRDAA